METLPVHQPLRPSAYEREALQQIHAWRNPEHGFWSKASTRFNTAWNSVTDLVRQVPGVDWTIENVFSGLLQLVNEMTQDSVWTTAILDEYAMQGHTINALDDIYTLDLADADALSEGLKTKYNVVAGAEGATTGLAGAAGIVPDIVALVSINLRMAGEYATYYGFDVTTSAERLYALQVLDAVSQPSDATKDFAFAPIVRVSKRVAQQQSLEAIQQLAITRTLKSIGSRLTRLKFSQMLPVASAVVAGSLNVYYTNKVCDAAYHLYRERFLQKKYGPRLFEIED